MSTLQSAFRFYHTGVMSGEDTRRILGTVVKNSSFIHSLHSSKTEHLLISSLLYLNFRKDFIEERVSLYSIQVIFYYSFSGCKVNAS